METKLHYKCFGLEVPNSGDLASHDHERHYTPGVNERR